MNTEKGVGVFEEKSVIARAQTGERKAFDELVNHYHMRMFRTAVRILGNESEAEDAVQQAFMGAYQNLARFRGDSAFATWMTRITMNEALGIVRKRRKNLVELNETLGHDLDAPGAVLASNETTPEEAVLRDERTRLVHESMRVVKPSYVLVMKMRVLEDLSVEEIAGRLKMPVNTVKVHLYRARQSMKTYLEPRLAASAA
jgi:RNA polymerase sigma-70 factor (ECF subfamily)